MLGGSGRFDERSPGARAVLRGAVGMRRMLFASNVPFMLVATISR